MGGIKMVSCSVCGQGVSLGDSLFCLEHRRVFRQWVNRNVNIRVFMRLNQEKYESAKDRIISKFKGVYGHGG